MYRSLIRLEPQSVDIEMREFLEWNFNEFPGCVGHATVGVTVYNLTSHIYELPPRYPYGAEHTAHTPPPHTCRTQIP